MTTPPTAVEHHTLCLYKGVGSYYDIGDAHLAWSDRGGYPGVGRISNLVSFGPDIFFVQLDGTQLHVEHGQEVFSHALDRDLEDSRGDQQPAMKPARWPDCYR